jgi:hypothetical protein
MQVVRYSSLYKEKWDSFIDTARVKSFLYKRDFMDYHSDRFIDFSFLVIENDRVKALLPANISENVVYSHQGLTYGGFLYSNEETLGNVILIVSEILRCLNALGVDRLVLKLPPRFYYSGASDEVPWVLFKLRSRLYRRDVALSIDNIEKPIPYQERRRRAIKKVGKSKVLLKQGFCEFAPFWEEVLIPNLLSKHGVAPVHSLQEIELLASRFPENIRQHNIYLDDKIVAGCTIFLNTSVAHAQYISGSEVGRNSGCLDYLFDHLIKNEYSAYRYFDFGICNEQEGQLINKGLLDWKEGFGARTIAHDFYEIDTDSYRLLENYTT